MKTLSVLPFAAAFILSTLSHAQDQSPGRATELQQYKPKEGREGVDQRDERFARMKRAIAELHRSGKHEEASRMEAELRGAWEREQGEAMRPESEVPEKIRHIMEAVRHLRAAGIDEPAEHLEQQARRMREELERHMHADAEREGRRDGAPAPQEAKQLQREIQELREQVQRLNQNVEKLRLETRRQHQEKDWQ